MSFLALCREKALSIRELVNEILNNNLKNCLNLVRNKLIIVKSQISIFEIEDSDAQQLILHLVFA